MVTVYLSGGERVRVHAAVRVTGEPHQAAGIKLLDTSGHPVAAFSGDGIVGYVIETDEDENDEEDDQR